jgi:lipoprotein-anchoring transpeptidase ErfK/SrfK
MIVRGSRQRLWPRRFSAIVIIPLPEVVCIMLALRRLLSALVIASLLFGCAQTPSRPAPERAPVAETGTLGSAEQEVRALTIKIGSQRFFYTEGDTIVRTGPISSGKEDFETPLGEFSVLSKQKDKVSYRYTNQLGMSAWMPYSIQFTGHYFLHEGWLPGHPDSHGCVRVGEKDARFLFERLQTGDRIVVVD